MSNQKKRFYTAEDVATVFAPKAARQVARRYRRYGTTYEDSLSECYVWMYEPKNQARLTRWLSNSPQQTARIYYSLLSAAQRAAEREKAEWCGYSVEDVHWYSLRAVEALLPLALNKEWNGTDAVDRDRVVDINEFAAKKQTNYAEGGDIVAQVMDVRRAVAAVGSDPAAVVNYLGGRAPESRKAMTNADSQAVTAREYAGE